MAADITMVQEKVSHCSLSGRQQQETPTTSASGSSILTAMT